MTAQLPSKVRLAQIASFSKSMALPPSHGEIEAMARALLAAHEQEPVGYYRLANDGVSYYLSHPTEKFDDDVIQLYAHPAPVPAVPDEMTIRDACKFVQDMRIFDDVAVIVMRTWNACRAAMLNGGKS